MPCQMCCWERTTTTHLLRRWQQYHIARNHRITLTWAGLWSLVIDLPTTLSEVVLLYDQPTKAGLSRKMMLATDVHVY